MCVRTFKGEERKREKIEKRQKKKPRHQKQVLENNTLNQLITNLLATPKLEVLATCCDPEFGYHTVKCLPLTTMTTITTIIRQKRSGRYQYQKFASYCKIVVLNLQSFIYLFFCVGFHIIDVRLHHDIRDLRNL
jgi:hypothetical protein